jgi:hypothetical protein
MRIGGSLFLIALGAVLTFAVKVNNTHGFSVHTAGVILMIVGAIGLIASALWMSTRRRTDIVERGALGTRGTTVLSPKDPAEPY